MVESFTNQITEQPELGRLVRELDLTRLVITLDDNWVRGVGPKLLLKLLSHTPLLREIRIGGQYGGARLHGSVWNSIFSQSQHLQSVSINDADSRNELQDFHLTMSSHSAGSIRNLAITKSYALPEQTVRNILSSQSRLESIDFSGSLITGNWFSSLPMTTRLKHIDLSDCLGSIDEDGTNHVVDFLSMHPAVTTSLQSLNVSCEGDLPSLGLTTKDMKRILSSLPAQSIKFLDLRGTPMTRDQLSLLERFPNLEELHVSDDFWIRDMEHLVMNSAYSYPSPSINVDPTQELLQLDISKTQHTSTLGPLAKSVLVCKLMQRINRVMPSKQSGVAKSKLRYLNLSTISRNQILAIMDSVLLAEESGPLEVIELGPSMLDWCDTSMKQLFRSAGWKPRNVGKRTWIERI